MHIVIVGLMGSGKTTVGELLAAHTQRPFRDCDDLLRARTGATAAEIADRDGLAALHALEADVLLDALADAHPSVITAAASTVEFDECRDALEDHFVAWLRVDVAVLATRVRAKRHRPLDEDVNRQLHDQAERRHRLFAAVADLVVDGSTSAQDAAAAIARRALRG